MLLFFSSAVKTSIAIYSLPLNGMNLWQFHEESSQVLISTTPFIPELTLNYLYRS
jgi:hypothetical protein